MRIAIIAFVAGIVWLQYQAELPAWWACVALAGLAVAANAHVRQRWTRHLLLALTAAAIGAGYAAGRAELRLSDRLATTLEQQPVTVEGVIVGLPQPSDYGPRLRLKVEHAPDGVPGLLLLSDYAKPAGNWASGQRWRLSVRLKRPHGSANPGAADYEAWLLGEGIGATGSIARQGRQLLEERTFAPSTLLDTARARLAAHIRQSLAGRPYTEVMVALVVGEQSGISQPQWQLFRNTGITHLVSISGLHITLVAGLLGGLGGWLWRRNSSLTLRLPARKAALLVGLLAAISYSLLAGFSIPTQRTCFMLAVAACALLSGRSLSVSRIWLLALGLTVLFDPWAVLSAGFWLSYLTVGAMLWALAGQQGEALGWRAKIAQWGAVQWAATLGSLPLLLILFQQLPLASPLANAIAIPLISSVATPLALAGALDPSGMLLLLAHWVLQATLWLLTPLSDSRLVWSQAAPAAWAMLPASLAVLALLLPRGTPGKLAASVLLLPLLLPLPTGLAEGAYQATVYDVGQGLAVLVQTREHSLLFDTGPPGGGGRVLPGALRAAGVSTLDVLVLSHGDNDHTGGASAILAQTPVTHVLGVTPYVAAMEAGVALPHSQPCLAGQQWQWNGVRFDMLHPYDALPTKEGDNAQSCVLRISSPGGSLLIPADIGVAQEYQLIANATQLKSDVLLLPHHGSNSSSSPAFVQAVAPRLAIATVGYLNRFHHPRPDIVARYRAAGATFWRSDHDGAVILAADERGWQAQRWRGTRPRYWHGPESRGAAAEGSSSASIPP
ncbi:ComEC/Rec2 family competence protein [Chitinimonas naiadis]